MAFLSGKPFSFPKPRRLSQNFDNKIIDDTIKTAQNYDDKLIIKITHYFWC
ncbi:MAG: hypothetical protein ACI85E_001415, partial [Marinomonas primoryensis]